MINTLIPHAKPGHAFMHWIRNVYRHDMIVHVVMNVLINAVMSACFGELNSPFFNLHDVL